MFNEFSEAVKTFVTLVTEASDGCLITIESGGYETHNPSGYMDKLTITRTPISNTINAEKMTYGRTIYGHYLYNGRESEERNDFLRAIKEVGRIFGKKLDERDRISFSILKGRDVIREGFPD